MEDKAFLNQISQWVEEADKREREYEQEKKRGNFDVECPYPELIGLYEYIRSLMLERGWNNEVAYINQLIQITQEKLEKDKKLREIEAQKAERERQFKELHKLKETDTMELVLDSLDKEEELLNLTEQKEREEAEKQEIFNLISFADTLDREYEIEKVKVGILSAKCPYERIIDIYKQAMREFEKIGWTQEARRLTDSINFYIEKIKRDNTLRAFERKRLVI